MESGWKILFYCGDDICVFLFGINPRAVRGEKGLLGAVDYILVLLSLFSNRSHLQETKWEAHWYLPVIWKKKKRMSLFLRAHAHRGDQVKSPLSLRTHSLLQYGSPWALLYWPYLGTWMELEDNCSIHLIVDCLALLSVIWDWHCNKCVRS